MGKNSGISWTNHTFNPWWGCQRVSPGCQHCYAETLDARWYDGVHWGGKDTQRKEMKPAYWDQVAQWNKEAKDSETPTTVFCASMADVFEDRPELFPLRKKLFKTIIDSPSLTWLLLTKRPENVERLIPLDWMCESFPRNVWLGVSVESQGYVSRVMSIAHLLVKRFVSVEPMLGPVTFAQALPFIHWVICGGESGAGYREMELSWVYDLLNECRRIKIPFFMKQMGGHPDKKDKLEDIPEMVRFQEFPNFDA